MREKEVHIQNSMKVKKVKASERLAAFKNKDKQADTKAGGA